MTSAPPRPQRPCGFTLPLRLDLVDSRTIRVLDILFVRCGQDGSVFTMDGRKLGNSALGAFHGAASGLLGSGLRGPGR